MNATEVPIERSDIEAGILPVCDALNEIEGVQTAWSCEGHFRRPASPFVIFHAPEKFVRTLQIELDLRTASGELSYPWWIRGNFIDGVLQWQLEANRKFSHLDFLPVYRKHFIGREILRLAAAIREIGKPGPADIHLHVRASDTSPACANPDRVALDGTSLKPENFGLPRDVEFVVRRNEVAGNRRATWADMCAFLRDCEIDLGSIEGESLLTAVIAGCAVVIDGAQMRFERVAEGAATAVDE